MSEPTCNNCTYETDEVDEVGLCQTCRRSYDLGWVAGYSMGVGVQQIPTPEGWVIPEKE